MRNSLHDDLDRWVGAGLLSREQSAAILEAETRIPPREPQRVPVFAEALGYAGAALAAAGVAVAIGQRWEEFGSPARIGIVAAATFVALGLGLITRRSDEPALDRLTSVLWALAVGGVAGTTALIGYEAGMEEGPGLASLASAAAILAGVILWRAHLRPLQQLATLGAVLVFVPTTLDTIMDPATEGFSLVLWIVGVAWALAGWAGLLEPPRVAVVAGAVTAAFAGISTPPDSWFTFVAIATGIALMAASVPTKELALLAIGAIALFMSVTQAVIERFGDTLGVPVTLTVVGGFFVALAAGSARLARTRRFRDRAASR